MKVVKINPAEAKERKDKIFRGKVTTQYIVGKGDNELRVAVVNFSQGAVNVFHTHTFDQILVITEGKGIVATKDKEITVTPGTIVVIPAGELHWHGATKDSAFSHVAIMPPGTTSF
jgi:quercetin dioxygenase-like cupin family protein